MKFLKLLSVADIHGSQYRLNIVLNNIEKYKPDLIVICGDITQFGPPDVALNLLNQIKIKTLAIHGNIDTNDVLKAIDESNAINIHNKSEIINKNQFIGLGGNIDNLDFSNINIKVNNNQKKLSEIINNSTIIISHIPPYGLQDKTFLGFHSGSNELKKFIEYFTPRLVLCGHIHENPGYVKFNNTIVVNCSIGKTGRGALIEINNSIKVTMLN